jgi:hypothetical protein
MSAAHPRYRLLHMMLAIAMFAILVAGFGVFYGITEIDLAFFLFGGLFPILLALSVPLGPPERPTPSRWSHYDQDDGFLRGLGCASAEAVMLAMLWSRMLASEFQSWSRSQNTVGGALVSTMTLKASGAWRDFQYW